MKVLFLMCFWIGAVFPFQSNEIDSLETTSKGNPFVPLFLAERDVKFYLFTRLNGIVSQEIVWGDLASVRNSNFNRTHQTRFLVHGWLNNGEHFLNIDGTRAYLSNGEFNVIVVDWGMGAETSNYIRARNRVGDVGRSLANIIDFMNQSFNLRFEDITVVGFSLGAHVAGIAGKTVRRGRINTIIGLDPAGPLFDINRVDTRLDSGDAQYVEIIHSNGRYSGFGLPMGHADFYPNGGNRQPGCITNGCAHDRAPLFFIESINSNRFTATRCQDSSHLPRSCNNDMPRVVMGGEPSNASKNLTGIFYLTTNRFSPFARQGGR